MAIYGAFTPAMMGMMSQSAALDNIGSNIANMNTGGYKKTETGFATVLSRSIQSVSDLGGVLPTRLQRIDRGGNIIASQNNLDTAINGHGFYMLNTELDGSGKTFYTRDGSFQTVKGADITVPADDGVSTITTQEAYLTDKNGYYVMAWQPQPDGSFNTAGPMSAMRVDSYAFLSSSISTTQANLDLNLPAAGVAGDSHLYNISTYDTNGGERAVTLDFVKGSTPNTWTVTPSWTDPDAAQVDTVSLGGTAEEGDVYSVVVQGTNVSYTAAPGDTLTDIRNGLMTAVNLNPSTSAIVTASASGASGITLTGNTVGSPFSSSTSSVQGKLNAAQIDTVTFGGAVEDGDTFTVTVAGVPFTRTVAAPPDVDFNNVRDALIIDINAAGLGVTASIGGADQLALTANVAGTPFTLSTGTADGGGGGAQTAAITNNTLNYTAIPDSTATLNSNFRGTPTTLTFDQNAQLVSPSTINVSASWGNGTSLNTTLDISNMTQFAGEFSPGIYWQNGYGTGQLQEISFDAQGRIQGQFTNTQTRALYRLGLATFVNPNGLEMISGNLFKESELSGEATIIAPDENSYGSISGNAREMSNVDVAQEFTNMIVTQQAYNSAATVFRTVDEMIVTARDLKR